MTIDTQSSTLEAQPSSPNLQAATHDSDAICLLDCLEVAVKSWRMIVSSMIIAGIVSAGISLSRPNIYTATTLILPPQQDQGLMGMLVGQMGGMANLAGDLFGKSNPAELYVGILSSNIVSDAIIDRFMLMNVYDLKYRLDAYKMLDSNVDISVGKKNGIIAISVQDIEPKRAAEMANAYVEELVKLTVQLNITGALENKAFLWDRLTKAKTDLAKTEDALKSFQAKNKIISVTDQAQATISGVAQLKAQLALQEVQLASLRQQFTDNNQDVKNVKASIANLNSQIARLEGAGVGGPIPSVGSVPELGEQYLRLMRELKIHETLVELLTKQYEIAKLSEAKDVSGVQIIQAAKTPDKKTKPKRTLIVLTTTFAVGFLALMYAFVRESFARMTNEDRERLQRIRRHLPSFLTATTRLRRIIRRDN